MKTVAHLSFLLITILWGSYYAIAREAFKRIDPVIFTFLEALVLVPIGLVLIALGWRQLNRTIIKRGIILGGSLCLAMLTVAVAEKFTTATNTAFFPSLGGVVAALITGLILKRSIGSMAWIAGALSLIGTAIIVAVSDGSAELRGDSIALLGALLYTLYIFLVDHDRQQHQGEDEGIFWLILGLEHLTIALSMTLIVLLFGNWQQFHPILPKDIAVVVYVATAATFVPAVLSTFMLRYVDPLEASFIFILEPIWGAIIAHFYLQETMPLFTYLGGAFIICGTIAYTWGTSGRVLSLRGAGLNVGVMGRQARRSVIGTVGYSLLLFCGGVILLDRVGGLPPTAWLDLYHQWPNLQELARQRQGVVMLLFLRALLWLFAWGALLAIGIVSFIDISYHLLTPSKKTAGALSLTTSYQPLSAEKSLATEHKTVKKFVSPGIQRSRVEGARRLSTQDPLPSYRIVDKLEAREREWEKQG